MQLGFIKKKLEAVHLKYICLVTEAQTIPEEFFFKIWFFIDFFSHKLHLGPHDYCAPRYLCKNLYRKARIDLKKVKVPLRIFKISARRVEWTTFHRVKTFLDWTKFCFPSKWVFSWNCFGRCRLWFCLSVTIASLADEKKVLVWEKIYEGWRN